MTIRVGILGAGATVAIADRHVEGFAADDRCRVTAVCSRTMESGQALCRRHGLTNALITTQADAFFDAVDAVVICTPNRLHFSQLSDAVAHGKHVLIEKPLGLCFAQQAELDALLSQSSCVVMAGYVYRWAAAVSALRALVQNQIGAVYSVDALQGGLRLADPTVPLEWRMVRELSGSGALGDFGSHLLDLVHYVADVNLVCATGVGNTFISCRPADSSGRTQVENDDVFAFCGKGKRGEICTFTMSRLGMDGPYLTVTGEGGLARMDLAHGTLYYLPKKPGGAYYTESEARLDTFADTIDERFCRQAACFLDAIEGKRVEYCTLNDAMAVEHILAGVEHSAWPQKTREDTL